MTEMQILLSSEKAINQNHRINPSIAKAGKDLSKPSNSTHCSSRDSLDRLPRIKCSEIFSIFRDVDYATSLGNLFLCLMTLK